MYPRVPVPAAPSRFPATHASLVQRIANVDPEVRSRALDTVARAYWAPIYAYIRLTHCTSPEDAEDLTQGFFAEALRRDLLARFDPTRARFRTYVRTCVDAYVANERKGERRLKRGGGAVLVSLDLDGLEERLRVDAGVDDIFDREWVRAIFQMAVDRLRERCRATGRLVHLALFERYDLADAGGERAPTYAALAAELGITTTQATNWLAAVRRDFRTIVVETLRELCGSDDELRAEARALLGVEVP